MDYVCFLKITSTADARAKYADARAKYADAWANARVYPGLAMPLCVWFCPKTVNNYWCNVV